MSQEKSFKFLRLPEVVNLTRLSKPTVYRLMKSGGFPKNYKLAERIVAWKDVEVLDWMSSRKLA